MRIFIGDTETTDLSADRRAIDLALIEIDEELNILGEAEALLNPQRPISAEASAVHGLYEADVIDKPTFEQWFADTWGGPIEGDCCLIGYRVAFDRPMIEPMFERMTHMWDVLTLAQTLVRDTKDHKLQTLREHFNLPGGPAHRAMGDVITTHQLLQVLLPMSGRPLTSHIATSFRFVHRMPWGKWGPGGEASKDPKGTLLIQVPAGYRNWLLDEAKDLDPHLRRSLEMLRETEIQLSC
jgi:DNA polymerase III epsilon subunit-like protein